MTEPTPPPPPPADDLELHTPVDYGELTLGYDWLAMACNVIQTLALMIIAVALVARL